MTAEGKAESTQAGEFVREEMHHIREGKHGARNAKHAIAIGLSKARRAGFDAGPSPTGSQTARVDIPAGRREARRQDAKEERQRKGLAALEPPDWPEAASRRAGP